MTFSVPATSANLGPGFDCLGLSLSLRNFFSISEADVQSIKITGEGSENPKFLQNNLFVGIFKQIYTRLGGQSQFSFDFSNKIPLSRGLGSSSAVISGAIFSAFKMAGKIPNKQEILDLALQYEKHPDNISPAIMGGFTASFINDTEGAKPKVIFVRQSIPSTIKAVVVVPNYAMATKRARHKLDASYSLKDCVFNLSRSSVLSLAFASHKWDLLRESSKDRLHEARRMQAFPVLFGVQKFALDHGALMSSLSGSGSSIFNLCYADEASSLQKKLHGRFPRFRVLSLDFDNDGVKLEA